MTDRDLLTLINSMTDCSRDLRLLIRVIERLIGEVSGLRLELQAARERWETGSEP